MKKYIIVIGILLTPLLVFAQDQKVISKFRILEARHNGVDFTDWSLSQNNYLVLFTDDDGETCLSNVTDEGQSYGGSSLLDYKEHPETKDTYSMLVYQFRWKYHNTYDSHRGSAIIELTVIHKPHASNFELKMIQENMDVNVYKGYIDGSIDFSNF